MQYYVVSQTNFVVLSGTKEECEAYLKRVLSTRAEKDFLSIITADEYEKKKLK